MNERPGAPPRQPPEEITLPPPPRRAPDYLVGFGKVLLVLLALGVGLAVLAFGTCLLILATH